MCSITPGRRFVLKWLMMGFLTKRKYVFVLGLIVLILPLFFLSYKEKKRELTPKTTGATASLNITSTDDWNLGSSSNVSVSSGSMEIADHSSGKLDLSEYNVYPITDGTEVGDIANVYDENVETGWSFGLPYSGPNPVANGYVAIDFGSEIPINKIRFYPNESWGMAFSVNIWGYAEGSPFDNVAYTMPADEVWHEEVVSISTRYLYFHLDSMAGMYGLFMNEIEIYSPSATATHATGSTQIDGGENFWEWETFTPTQTTPANTSITYRYRSSADGSNWNGWHSDIGDVESRSGETKYRYLQIEATLSNTDGASTPTIDSYDVGYHTNVTPSAPSNLTAVVGE